MKAMRRNASDGSSNNNKQSSLTSNRDSVDSAHSLPVSTQPRDNCSISSPSQARQCGDSGGSPYSNQSSPESRVTKRKQCKRWPPTLTNRRQMELKKSFLIELFIVFDDFLSGLQTECLAPVRRVVSTASVKWLLSVLRSKIPTQEW